MFFWLTNEHETMTELPAPRLTTAKENETQQQIEADFQKT